MQKAVLARLVPKLGECLPRPLQASLQMGLQKLPSIRFANDQHWIRPLADCGGMISVWYWSSRAALGAIGGDGCIACASFSCGWCGSWLSSLRITKNGLHSAFEMISGKNKGFEQIARKPNAYLALEDLPIGARMEKRNLKP